MILYIQTAFLGDLLLSIPTLRRLKKLYPQHELHLLCRKNLGGFFIKQGLVDKVFDNFQSHKPNWQEIKKNFSQQKYELLICPHESTRSSLISCKINAQTKIGFDNLLNKFIFDKCIKRPMHLPEALRQMSLLQTIDPELTALLQSFNNSSLPMTDVPDWSSMSLSSLLEPLKHRHYLVEKLSLNGQKKVIFLAPGSVWETKRWGVKKYIQLAQFLIERGHQVVLIGSPDEKSISEEIKSKISQVSDITGTTSIPELVTLMAGADLLVCNDSGAMHMAATSGIPTVAIFGPTVQAFGYQPWNKNAVVVENLQLRCRPCSSHGGKKCPIGTHECMTSIAPEAVMSQIESLLSQHAIL